MNAFRMFLSTFSVFVCVLRSLTQYKIPFDEYSKTKKKKTIEKYFQEECLKTYSDHFIEAGNIIV